MAERGAQLLRTSAPSWQKFLAPLLGAGEHHWLHHVEQLSRLAGSAWHPKGWADPNIQEDRAREERASKTWNELTGAGGPRHWRCLSSKIRKIICPRGHRGHSWARETLAQCFPPFFLPSFHKHFMSASGAGDRATFSPHGLSSNSEQHLPFCRWGKDVSVKGTGEGLY